VRTSNVGVSTVENDVLVDGYWSALADGQASRSRCEIRLGQIRW
jgi:hypothetical protein